MTITINASFLPQTNPEEATAFYRDVLGFEVRKDVGYNGLHWITVGPAGQPDTSVVLFPPEASPGVTEEEKEVLAGMRAKGTFGMLLLASTDVDADFASIEATGAEVVQEPTDQPYGVRDCAFRDPSGNMIRLQQAG